MAKEFLDPTGLAHAFTKIKTFVNTAVSNGIATKAPLHAVQKGITTAGTGEAYTATVDGITALTAGATFMMIPHTVSTSKTATLNVNGLGAKTLRRRLSNSTTSTVAPASTNWLGASKPVRVFYDGTYWIADFTRPNAADMYGTLPIANGGTGATTAAAAFSNIVTDGSVTRAKLAQDALYSPVNSRTSDYTIAATDLGKTITFNSSSALTITFDDSVALTLPTGSEIAIVRWGVGTANLVFSGEFWIAHVGDGWIKKDTDATVTVQIPERFGMIALKRITSVSWLVTGDVEVVS